MQTRLALHCCKLHRVTPASPCIVHDHTWDATGHMSLQAMSTVSCGGIELQLDKGLALSQGLQGMKRHEGAGTVLVAAAMRAHHKLTEAVAAEQDWARAKSLYEQVGQRIPACCTHLPACSSEG